MSDPTDDIAQLREAYPQWNFTAIWAAAGSGPDVRLVVATRDGVILSDLSAAALRRKIAREG